MLLSRARPYSFESEDHDEVEWFVFFNLVSLWPFSLEGGLCSYSLDQDAFPSLQIISHDVLFSRSKRLDKTQGTEEEDSYLYSLCRSLHFLASTSITTSTKYAYNSEPLTSYKVCRKLFLYIPKAYWILSPWEGCRTKKLVASKIVRQGACTVLHMGTLCDHGSFNDNNWFFPHGYRSYRIYWSTTEPGKVYIMRCWGLCSVFFIAMKSVKRRCLWITSTLMIPPLPSQTSWTTLSLVIVPLKASMPSS